MECESDPIKVAEAAAYLEHQRLKSASRFQVARAIKAPKRDASQYQAEQADETEMIAKVIPVERQMDVRRAELLLERYLPQALMPAITVEAIERGIPIARESLDYPMRAALIVLEILKYRARLLGLNRGESRLSEAKLGRPSATDVMEFLRSQMGFVQQMVKEAPRDTLNLELEIEIDKGNGAATPTHP